MILSMPFNPSQKISLPNLRSTGLLSEGLPLDVVLFACEASSTGPASPAGSPGLVYWKRGQYHVFPFYAIDGSKRSPQELLHEWAGFRLYCLRGGNDVRILQWFGVEPRYTDLTDLPTFYSPIHVSNSSYAEFLSVPLRGNSALSRLSLAIDMYFFFCNQKSSDEAIGHEQSSRLRIGL